LDNKEELDKHHHAWPGHVTTKLALSRREQELKAKANCLGSRKNRQNLEGKRLEDRKEWQTETEIESES